jgi:hypothetical protein
MEPAMPNTHRENVQMRHPELRPGARAPTGATQFPQRRQRTARATRSDAARATPKSAAADEALIDAALAGRLREFLDQDDLIEAALRGQLREVLDDASAGSGIVPTGPGHASGSAADVDPKVRQALHDVVGTDDALAEHALETLLLHVRTGQ